MSSKIGAKRGRIISMIAKPMGLIIAPLAFALITVIVLLTALNETVGDVIGYGSVLFMKRESAYEAQNIFEPSSKESGTVNIEDIRFPKFKDVYGEIIIESAGIDCPLVFGDSEACLARGAGQYIGSTIIGYGGTTMVCAHINRQFANLHKVKPDDYIKIITSYGYYVYKVTYAGVNSANDTSVYDLMREDENVVLYTCYYERTALGSVKKRYFVCADYISGPMLVNGEVSE